MSAPRPPKPLIVFGAGQIAEVADFYFRTDGGREVVAFVVDAAYVDAPSYRGRPLVALEDVVLRFPPAAHDAFVAVSYARLNQLRAEKCGALRGLGYSLASYVSPRATVYDDFEYGENCLILEDNTIQPFARVGENVVLWSGNHIGHHAVIGDHCFLASHVVISGSARVGDYTFIGVNATVTNGVTIGQRCIIGAGALITADVADDGVYAPHPTERSRAPSSRVRL